MFRLTKAMNDKQIPFVFVLGDFPAYLYFLKVKSENASKFTNIYPHLGPFHMHKSYLNANDLQVQDYQTFLLLQIVSGSGSIDKALCGEHYKRALRGHFLLREALSLLIIKQTNLQVSDVEKEKI